MRIVSRATLTTLLIWLTHIGGFQSFAVAQTQSEDAFFESRVRPLLVDHCLKCHGTAKAESGLRLDSRAAMLQGGESGPALVPGDPQASLLMRAVRRVDGLEMPPDAMLAEREIAALERWIAAGAAWPEGVTLGSDGPQLRGGPITQRERRFWSLQPITDPQPPDNGDVRWSQQPLDRFVKARLEDSGLNPQPPADRRTLIRRVTFDLTGLPPTPEEIEAFVADQSPLAWSRLIDRLLASPAYGERWGRHWLDVVRYADTAGETGDYPTPLTYRYRNWVIEAFQQDLPYDEFIRQQIAGDLLAARPGTSPEDYRRQLTATGFIAISRRFGFDVENYHNLTIQDTLDTVGQAFLGLTIGCARCHDHKYDPVNTEDYYAWYGIFASTRYSFPGSEEKKRPYDAFPAVPADAAATIKQQHETRLARLDERIETLQSEFRLLDGQLKLVAANADESASTVRLQPWSVYLQSRLLGAQQADADGHTGFHVWRTDRSLPLVAVNVSTNTYQVPGTVPPRALVVHPQEAEGAGIAWRSPVAGRVRIEGRISDAHDCGDSVLWFIDHLSSNGLTPLANGSVDRASAASLHETSKALAEITVAPGDFLQLAVLPKTHYGCDLTRVEWEIRLLDSDRTWNLARDVADGFLTSNPRPDGQGHDDSWWFYQVATDRGAGFAKDNSTETVVVNLTEARRRHSVLRSELAELTPQRDRLRENGPYAMIYGAIEGTPADARIQIRGDKLRLGDTVVRRNLEILGGEPVTNGSGRLELADWLTRPDNPLTARVMVNRIWQQHFGRGLVATENDFGNRGVRPTHPELLDWLATRFREAGWSVKAMHRLMLQSQTYRQASSFDAAAARQDPDARLLWRFNRRRLSAEEIRDSMLFVSGNLDPTPGGAHPFPDSSTWGFTQHAPFYGVYPTNRRSVYLMQQRLKRHPYLALFDAADPNVPTARRELTTVPTQALFLMNNPFVHEQSQGLADRLAEWLGDTRQRIDRAFQITLGRPAANDEVLESERFLVDYTAALQTEAAGQANRMAWAAFARTLLTRNEFLHVD